MLSLNYSPLWSNTRRHSLSDVFIGNVGVKALICGIKKAPYVRRLVFADVDTDEISPADPRLVKELLRLIKLNETRWLGAVKVLCWACSSSRIAQKRCPLAQLPLDLVRATAEFLPRE